MVNALQIIIILPLVEASMPANAGQVFKQLMKIAAFDVLETSEFVDEVLALEPKDPVSVNLESLGFETQWFINNVGSFFIYLLLCFVGVILYLLVYAFNVATGCASKLRS